MESEEEQLTGNVPKSTGLNCKDGSSSRKRKRENKIQGPRSLDQIMKDTVSRIPEKVKQKETDVHVISKSTPTVKVAFRDNTEVIKIDGSNSHSGKDSGVRSTLRKAKKGNSGTPSFGDIESRRHPILISSSSPSRLSRSSSKKVRFAESSIRNKRKGRVISEDVDNDFVNPVPLVVAPSMNLKAKLSRKKVLGKRQQVKKKVGKRPVAGIRTRTSPMMLHDMIDMLTLSQREAVISMGLGSFLSMSVDGIPSKLGYYVVDNLNTDTMVIELENGSIPINEERIHEVLGVPNDGIDLDSICEDSRSQVLFRHWRSRYGQPNKKIRPSEVVTRIITSGLADDDFKVDFMVLFVNSMAECSPMGCCYLHFMNKITSIDMISNINWSRYIFESVRRCKRIWRRDTYESYFAGPLTFLSLLYVHYTVNDAVAVNAATTPLHTWDINLLRQRVLAAKTTGGLKMAILKGQDVVELGASTACKKAKKSLGNASTGVNVKSQQKGSNLTHLHPDGSASNIGLKVPDEMDKGCKSGFTSATKESKTNNDPAYETECGDTELPDFDPYDVNSLKHDFISRIEFQYHVIYEAKLELEELLEDSGSFFPDEDVFVNYHQTYATLFGENEPYEPDGRRHDSADRQDGSIHDVSVQTVTKEVIMDDPTEVQLGKEDIIPTKLDFGSVGSPDQLTPLSPIWCSQTTFNILDAAAMTSGGGTSAYNSEVVPVEMKQNNRHHEVVEYEVPSDVRPLNVMHPSGKGKEKEVDVGLRAHNRREAKPSIILRSPYMRRHVIVGKVVQPEEQRVHDLCMAAFGRPDDPLYKSTGGQLVTRAPMESLAADEHIFTNVIDGWVDLLNYEERYRSPDSPRRYFFKTSVLNGEVLLDDTHTFQTRFKTFHSNLAQSANYNTEILKLRNYDLVFFPMIRNQHYFCVVFHMKTYKVDIIDNIAHDGDIYGVYDTDIHILRLMFMHHLERNRHPAGTMMEPIKDNVIDFSWKSTGNYIDCGVFLMRHMETYMGRTGKLWDCGLTSESQVQKKQLQNLRKKYVAKMLLSERNGMKIQIGKELHRLFLLTEHERDKLLKKAEKTRFYRLRKF